MNSRRVVTGLDKDGRSCVTFEGPAGGGLIWRSDLPADNSGEADAGAQPVGANIMSDGRSSFILVEVPLADTPAGIGMHATDTLDYLVILRGEIILTLETGEVHLFPGDLLVDRGVLHGFRAVGAEPGLMAAVIIPALPVGKGTTI